MRVVVLGNQAFSLLNFRGDLIRVIVKRGHEVLALAPNYDEATREAVRALGAKPIGYSLSRTGLNPLRDLRDFVVLVFLLRRLKPDLLFSCAIKPTIYGTLAGWIVGIPKRFAMIEGLGYAFVQAGEKEGLKRRVIRFMAQFLYRLALPKATKVFFLNRDDLAVLSNRELGSYDGGGGIGDDEREEG